MARWWSPRIKVVCVVCDWEGTRTRATTHYLCPKCYPLGKHTGKFKIYKNARRTVREKYPEYKDSTKKK